jgi:uncharacterized membrane protein
MGVMRVLAVASAVAVPCLVLAEPSYHRVTGVAANDTLNIRSTPDASSADIGDLAYDAQAIEVLDFDPTGRWARVALAESDGWVSTRFLERDTVLTIGETSLPVGLVCTGTEPFWAIGLFDGLARFSHPESNLVDLPFLSTSVAEGHLGSPALISTAGPKATAEIIVSAEACSDGMSDRSYGWTVNLLIQSDGMRRFVSGCCHLPLE